MTRWILLRGLMRDSRHWGDFPALLRERFPQASIELLDLPGNGALFRDYSPPTVRAMADYCRRALRERGFEPPYRVLAMSLGAMVTVDWAARYPQELQAAVLINTSLRPYSAFYQRLRPRVYGPLLRLLLTRPGSRTIEQTICELTSRHHPGNAAVVDDWVGWRESHPVSRANTVRQLLAAVRFQAPAQAPATSLLLLASQRDGLVDPHCSQRLADAWGIPLRQHPTAGHDLPLDDGAWVAQQINDWQHSIECCNRG
jgi:pimeloyl-ACP methyl ester carboxylesterase